MHPPTTGWNVIDADAGVLTHTYHFRGSGTSTTFVARMANGQLLVVSPAKGLTDALAAELEAFGPVGALVANNGWHHLGQAEWRQRYPTARCFAPPEAMARIRKKNPTAGEFEPLAALAALTGPHVGFRVVPDTRAGESWYWARIRGGHAWFTSDVLANLQKLPPGLFGLMFKWTRSAPGFRVFHLAQQFIVKDKRAMLRLVLEDLEAHPPTVIVPAHGDILSHPGVADEARRLVQAALG